MHIAENAQKEIVQDMFGTISGSEHQNGLVDSKDEDDIAAKLASAQSRCVLSTEDCQPQFHAGLLSTKQMKCNATY